MTPNNPVEASHARTPWLAYHKPVPEARLRLFCFPFAGGSALTFRRWQSGLQPHVEVCPVQLPGRGGRLREPASTSLLATARAVAENLRPYTDKPFAFFGHSMGAMIAFELARQLRRDGGPQPLHLFVSGGRAPQLPRTDPITYNLPEPQLVAELRRLNGTPPEVLEHPELMALMLPLLRADFEAVETYLYTPEPPLACPLTAFGGLEDREVAQEQIEAWRAQTTGPFSVRMLPGDHFFLINAEPLMLRVIAQELARHTA
jgi:medium-chain acyl-[acyl-carrier-protein] hydrolase